MHDTGMSVDQKFRLAYEEYYGTMRTFARNCVMQLPGMEIDDIVQELAIVLHRCVLNYDPDRGAKFKTLFQGCALRRVISMVRATQTQKRSAVVVSIDREDIALAVQGMGAEASAEDWCLAIADHGPKYVKALQAAAS